ncbi:MAG: hypothetical protein D4R65_15520 [Verrucomicrobiaceae bacterium]|nr:MAG: hypothetical protein D4R65_15520 [Verrucomicrobiaceae bacterium]
MRFVLTALVAATLSAHAQVQVDIALKRNLYIIYEPILATVTITNMTGSELSLADSGQNKWFGLQVETMDGRPIPPLGGDYTNAPLELGPQQKISRTVNLTPLFPISEFGGYRARATVYTQQRNRFFTSPSLNFEITDGRPMWQKTVGVPDGAPGAGTSRTITLLSHRLPQSTQLYLRIEDKQAGKIYCTHQLGRFLTFGSPNVMLDRLNNIHVLQNSAPKTFIYSKIGLNGEVLERKSFNEFSTRPALRRGSDGSVLVVGGQAYDPTAPPPEQSLPSLNDRPVDLPGAKQKPTPDDKRPENLLSR